MFEFSTDMVRGGILLAEVFMASIGILRRESVMVLEDMVACFKEVGFKYVA